MACRTHLHTGGRPVLQGAAGRSEIPGVVSWCLSVMNFEDLVVFETSEEGAVVPEGCTLSMECYADESSSRSRLSLPAGARFWIRRKGDKHETCIVETAPLTKPLLAARG